MPLHRGNALSPLSLSDVVKWELPARFCRRMDLVWIEDTDLEDMPIGQCLEWGPGVGAGGEDAWIKATAAADCDAILMQHLRADPDVAVEVLETCLVMVRGPAVVSLDALTYDGAFDAADVAASLEAEGIIARTGPDYDILERT